jgi:hypothetical protein
LYGLAADGGIIPLNHHHMHRFVESAAEPYSNRLSVG